MKNRIAVAGSILLLASPVSAQAADLIIEEPAALVASSAIDWSGAYVGVHGGFGSGKQYVPGSTGDGTDIEGSIAGVQAGYNVQIDNFVLGIEGDVSWSNVGWEQSIPLAELAFTADWLATLRTRAGYAIDGLLFYATAGLAAGGATADMYAEDPNLPNQTIDYSESNTHYGWVAGLGAEAVVTDSISLKAEYLYRDLGGKSYAIPISLEPVDIAARAHTVTVGVNFHF